MINARFVLTRLLFIFVDIKGTNSVLWGYERKALIKVSSVGASGRLLRNFAKIDASIAEFPRLVLGGENFLQGMFDICYAKSAVRCWKIQQELMRVDADQSSSEKEVFASGFLSFYIKAESLGCFRDFNAFENNALFLV